MAMPMQMMMPPPQAVISGYSGDRFATHWSDACGNPGGCGRCVGVACCMPCTFGRIAGSLPRDNGACCAGNECGACFSYSVIGGSIYGVGAFFFGCFAAGLVPLVGTLTACMHVSVRRGLKRQHGIANEPGCAGNDVALAMCCDPCIMCQEIREVELRQPRYVMQMQPPTVFVPPHGHVMVNPLHAGGGGGYGQPQGVQMQQMRYAAAAPMQPMPPQQHTTYVATVGQPVAPLPAERPYWATEPQHK